MAIKLVIEKFGIYYLAKHTTAFYDENYFNAK
jgi:hypothetical protein